MSQSESPSNAVPAGADTASERRGLRFSLQMRLTFWVIGLALAVGGVVAVVSVDFNARLATRLHYAQCRQTASLIASRAVEEFADGKEAMRILADELTHADDVLFVVFMNTNGMRLAQSRDRRVSPSMPITAGFTPQTTIGTPVYQPRTKSMGPYLDVTYPIRATNPVTDNLNLDRMRLMGYVRLGLSLEHTIAQMSAATNILTGVTLIVLALTIPLGFLIVRSAIRPLRQLADTMVRLADGDFTARLPVYRTDEIGDLAVTYNLMVQRLADKHRQVTELNASLEARVQQRTKQLRDLASRDPLTGLYNRRHFTEVLDRRFAEARRYKTELACMMVDLDDFKQINDQFGHQVGDKILLLTALTITSELRAADVAARYGGDEFIVLLPQTDTLHAQVLGERIIRKFNATIAREHPKWSSTLSIGVACTTDVSATVAEDLIRAGDDALYAAKTRGKNTVVTRSVSV